MFAKRKRFSAVRRMFYVKIIWSEVVVSLLLSFNVLLQNRSEELVNIVLFSSSQWFAVKKKLSQKYFYIHQNLLFISTYRPINLREKKYLKTYPHCFFNTSGTYFKTFIFHSGSEKSCCFNKPNNLKTLPISRA